MRKRDKLGCSFCNGEPCRHGNFERMPKNCPTLTSSEIVEDAIEEYRNDPASKQLCDTIWRSYLPYTRKQGRVEALVGFCHDLGIRKIGIATCVAFLECAQILEEILEAQGFQTITVCCQAGAVDSRVLGYDPASLGRQRERFTLCNPIAQAEILNEGQTEINIMLGLCLGHDMIFTRYAQAPTTVMAIKDYVYDHKPSTALLTRRHPVYKRLVNEQT